MKGPEVRCRRPEFKASLPSSKPQFLHFEISSLDWAITKGPWCDSNGEMRRDPHLDEGSQGSGCSPTSGSEIMRGWGLILRGGVSWGVVKNASGKGHHHSFASAWMLAPSVLLGGEQLPVPWVEGGIGRKPVWTGTAWHDVQHDLELGPGKGASFFQVSVASTPASELENEVRHRGGTGEAQGR